jgi:C-terminal processing protease CtpA/Prc
MVNTLNSNLSHKKKKDMKKSIAIVLSILITTIVCLPERISAQTPKKYSVKEVKADFKYLYETLEKSNYDLFARVSKEEMDRAYQAIYNSISDSLSNLEIYRFFQPFVAKAGMSHCNLSRPWGAYVSILKKEAAFFPLHLHFSKGKVYVKDNFSTNKSVSISDEVLSFNGIPMRQLMTDLYKNMSGPSNYYNASILEAYSFPRLYWLFKGECNEFKLRIKKTDGEESDIVLNAISGNELEAALDARSSDDEEREFYLTDNNIAYLRPGKFSNIHSKGDLQDQNTFDNSEFCQFIDSAFLAFNKKESKYLILDLRNNMGGDNLFSDYMTAYFATKPFSIASRCPMKTSQVTKDFFKDVDNVESQELKEQIMTLEDGSYFESKITQTNPHGEPKRFKGKVYVLINRYSYSMSAYAAAIIQDYQFGEIIGEETAEEVTSYVASHVFKLPSTQITVQYPKGFAVRPSGDETLRGVVPDHVVNENIFTDEDEILDYTINLIEKK